MTKKSIWRPVANSFGGMAYLAVFFQWTWLLITLVVPAILSNAVVEYLTMPRTTDQPVDPTPAMELSLSPMMQTIIVVLSISFAIGITLYAIYMVPKTISRTGRTVVHRAAKVAVKQTTVKQPIKPRQKQSLLNRYSLLAKLMLIVIPLIALLIPTSLDLDHQLVVVVGLFLSVLSSALFGLQLLIAYLAKVPLKQLW